MKDSGYATDYNKQKSQSSQKDLGNATRYHSQKSQGSQRDLGYSTRYHSQKSQGTVRMPTEGGFLLVKPQKGKMYQTNTVGLRPTSQTHKRMTPGNPVSSKKRVVKPPLTPKTKLMKAPLGPKPIAYS